MAFLIGGANSAAADTGYDIANSLRAGDSTNYKLARTPSSNGSERIFTFSAWVKRGSITDNREILFRPDSGNPWADLEFQTDDSIICMTNGGSGAGVVTNRLFRDVSAWYHLVCAVDTTQSTEANRVKIYVNGVLETSFSESNYMAQDADTTNNQTDSFTQIFGDSYGNHLHMADVYWIDGTQYAASDFGETDEDSGIWKPKEAKNDLTFGTNGFFLEFKQTGTNQDSSGIGADTSGNDNHLAVTGFDAQDQTTDTPTNNFATMNPLDAGSEATLSEGNCKYTGGTTVGQSQLQMCGGTFGVSNGKWYFEVKRISNNAFVGIYAADHGAVNIGYTNAFQSGWNGYSHGVYTSTGNARSGNADTAYGSAIDDDDIIGVALDLDNGAIYYSDNGTFMDSGDPTSGASKTGAASNFTTTVETWILGFISDGSSGASGVYEFNFGNPSFAISSGNADANGYGNFEYAVPSGYYAPCTKNLAEYG